MVQLEVPDGIRDFAARDLFGRADLRLYVRTATGPFVRSNVGPVASVIWVGLVGRRTVE